MNGYFPVGRSVRQTGRFTTVNSTVLRGTSVGTLTSNFQGFDTALTGGEIQVGRYLFNNRAEIYAGYYAWHSELDGSTHGASAGLRGGLTEWIFGEVNFTNDDFFGSNVFGGVTIHFDKEFQPSLVRSRRSLFRRVERNTQIAVREVRKSDTSFAPIIDATSGAPIRLFVASEGGTGDGTFADPSNVSSILMNPDFREGSALLLVDTNGVVTSPITLNADRQQVIGGGSNGTAQIDFSSATGSADDVLTLTGLGGRPIFSPTGTNAITLTNGNVIQGFTINGSGGATNGIVGTPGASNTTIADMILRDLPGNAIDIQPSVSTTLDNVMFQNNGQDAVLNASSTTIRNVMSLASIGTSFTISNTTGMTTIENLTITNSGGDSLVLNNPGGTINASNVNIANPVGRAFVVDGGDANIDVTGGLIAKNTAGNIIDVQDRAGGNITIAADVRATAGSSGIVNTGAIGNNILAFTGDVDLGTSFSRITGGDAVTVDHNGTNSTTWFSDLEIFTNGGNGLFATNGGLIRVDRGVLDTQLGRTAFLNGVGMNVNLGRILSVDAQSTLRTIELQDVFGNFRVAGKTDIIRSNGQSLRFIDVTGSSSRIHFGDVSIEEGRFAYLEFANVEGELSFGNYVATRFLPTTPNDNSGLRVGNVKGNLTFESIFIGTGRDTAITFGDIIGAFEVTGTTIIENTADGFSRNCNSSAISIGGSSGDIIFNSVDVRGFRGNSANEAIVVSNDDNGRVFFNGQTTVELVARSAGIEVQRTNGDVFFDEVTIVSTDLNTAGIIFVQNDDADITINKATITRDSTGTSPQTDPAFWLLGDESDVTIGDIAINGGSETAVEFRRFDGTYVQTGTMKINNVENEAIIFRDSAGNVQIPNVVLDGVGQNGVTVTDSTGTLSINNITGNNITGDAFFMNNAGPFNVNGGSITNVGGDGNNLQNSIFNLNIVSFDQIIGDVIEAGGSTLSGSGNSATNFGNFKVDNGGNTGSIDFGATGSFP